MYKLYINQKRAQASAKQLISAYHVTQTQKNNLEHRQNVIISFWAHY